MDKAKLESSLMQAPVVASVKDWPGLELCLQGQSQVVFILFGNVMTIGDIVQKIRQADKVPIVHVDLIEGLAAREISVDFIASETQAAGIISTRLPLIRRASELGLIAIRRFFMLDSMALQTIQKQIEGGGADFIEVLPGAMPKVLARIVTACPLPVIAGGLISDKEDVLAALSSGAVAVSTTNPNLWVL